MNDIKQHWIESREHWSALAEGMKDSMSIVFNLQDLYKNLSNDEKLIVHGILAEWLLSEDSALRYEASYLISEEHIKSLRDVVEKAIPKAEGRKQPEAKYEVLRLKRILSELEY